MRTVEEILANPMMEDTVQSTLLGYNRRGKHIWVACPSCERGRWIRKDENKGQQCRSCAHMSFGAPPRMRYGPDAKGEYKTIKVGDVPKEGDLIRGGEINRCDRDIYRWTRCPMCGECRWLPKELIRIPNCRSCTEKNKKTYIGEANSQWRGGRAIHKSGYIYVIVREDSPYYPMRIGKRYVAEHRLVMAQYLGRCLERWEVVHHKHTKYPKGSREDKQDNRIENLELMPTRHAHDAITILEKQVGELKQQIADLTRKGRLNEWRIKELESSRKKDEIL